MKPEQPGALATCSDCQEHPGVLGVSGEVYLKGGHTVALGPLVTSSDCTSLILPSFCVHADTGHIEIQRRLGMP